MRSEITPTQFVKSYWNYYLELEEQLLQTKRFVDFDTSNYKTFSIEYLKLLQAACSEIDVVAKIMAEKFDSNFVKLNNKNIQKWGFVLQQHFNDIGEKDLWGTDVMPEYKLMVKNDSYSESLIEEDIKSIEEKEDKYKKGLYWNK